MILVADSGSTKTNWIFQENGENTTISTIGLNPLFIDSEGITIQINNSVLGKMADKFTSIYFYGASCSSELRNNIVLLGLQKVFINASTIIVDHDMKAASIALCGDKPGVACILGTGANSCIWNGNEIEFSIEAPGFILGDEASGAYFGKKLIALYLYNRLPKTINEYIEQNYKYKKDEIYKAVYQDKFPNLFLASYAKVYAQFKEEPLINEILNQGFQEFVTYHILPYKGIQNMPIHFVGSIGFHFQDIIKKVLESNQLTAGKFMANPIESLLKWHLERE